MYLQNWIRFLAKLFAYPVNELPDKSHLFHLKIFMKQTQYSTILSKLTLLFLLPNSIDAPVIFQWKLTLNFQWKIISSQKFIWLQLLYDRTWILSKVFIYFLMQKLLLRKVFRVIKYNIFYFKLHSWSSFADQNLSEVQNVLNPIFGHM